MVWSTNDGVASTINLTHSSGAETMFILKRLLKNEGWTVLSSSDGTTYNASGDQISSSGSGAGGMDNTSAWFRIEDPASLREYVFQRGTQHYSWRGLYSASDGFTGGTPNATIAPTATDQQGIIKAATTYQTMFPTSGSWRAHIAAQDAAHNGVYVWWCCVNVSTAEEMFLACDAINSATTSGDNDPCIHYGSDDSPIYATIASTNITTNSDSFRGWMRYGENDETWSGITAAYYYTASSVSLIPFPTNNNFVIDPHDSKVKTLDIHWFMTSSVSISGYKGAGKYIKWNPDNNTYAYQDLIQDGTDYWLVWADVLLAGWPDSTTPGT